MQLINSLKKRHIEIFGNDITKEISIYEYNKSRLKRRMLATILSGTFYLPI